MNKLKSFEKGLNLSLIIIIDSLLILLFTFKFRAIQAVGTPVLLTSKKQKLINSEKGNP